MNSLCYTITIDRRGMCLNANALYDTGNRLKSITTGSGILIIPWKLAQNLMTAEEKRRGKRILRQLYSGRKPFILKEFYLITYRTIDFGNRFMPGLVADRVSVHNIYGDTVVHNIMLGITEKSYSKYQCLLPEDIFDNYHDQVEKVR